MLINARSVRYLKLCYSCLQLSCFKLYWISQHLKHSFCFQTASYGGPPFKTSSHRKSLGGFVIYHHRLRPIQSAFHSTLNRLRICASIRPYDLSFTCVVLRLPSSVADAFRTLTVNHIHKKKNLKNRSKTTFHAYARINRNVKKKSYTFRALTARRQFKFSYSPYACWSPPSTMHRWWWWWSQQWQIYVIRNWFRLYLTTKEWFLVCIIYDV